ncbi:MAG: phospholipase A [Proteobacteria bacterium]|nr:phospholipase A [Pseudomonadota bacterium]
MKKVLCWLIILACWGSLDLMSAENEKSKPDGIEDYEATEASQEAVTGCCDEENDELEPLPINYKENYILYTVSDSVDNRLDRELKFQISVQARLFKKRWAPIVFYTQKSFWQVFDDREQDNGSRNSHSFREHNYNPGFYFNFNINKNLLMNLGYEHESNGEEDTTHDIYNPHPGRTINRSANRLFVEGSINFSETWDLYVKGITWIALSEDNSDIDDYYGSWEARIRYNYRKKNKTRGYVSIWARKKAIQIDLVFRCYLNWYFQYWNGYGESLIDYDVPIVKHGFGALMFF